MQKGFSLIELSAVIVIAGLVTVGVGDMYRVQHQYTKATEDYTKFGRLSQALSEFYSINGRYPCPSDPSLPLTAPNSGIEQVDFVAKTCTPSPVIPTNVVRTNNGTRRTLANTDPNPAATDYVAIGAFPYATIINFLKTNGFQALTSQYDTLDSWNNQMTYVVTESMAAQAGVSPSDGAVDVQTESGQELTYPPGSAQYILLSHGDDGVGAYNQSGVVTAPCPPNANATVDAQNCRYTLNPASVKASGLFIAGLRSMGAGKTYFDDQVYFFAIPLNALWAPVANPADTRPDIYNLNAGGVGIGTGGLPLGNPGSPDPKVQFQVNGNLRAAQGNIVTPQICDTDGNNCFDPAFIGGPSNALANHPNTCPSGQTMSGITGDSTNYQVSCIPSGVGGGGTATQVLPTTSAGSASTGCGLPGYAVYGFELLGGGNVWTPVCQLVQ